MRKIRAFLRLAIGLLITTAVFGTTAGLLLYWVGPPYPDHLPSSAELSAFAADPLASSLGRTVLACIAWLLLLTLAAATALQAWTQRSPRRTRLQLPRPLQIATAGLLGLGALNLANPTHPHHSTDTFATVGEHLVPGAQSAATPAHPAPTRSADTANGRAEDGREHDARPHSNAHRDGVQLPHGWLAWPTASGILATGAAALLNGTHSPSASALLRHVRAARHPDADPDSPDPSDPTADDILLLERDAATQTSLHVAATDSGYQPVEALPRSGVGLAGPGASDALRGLLAAAAVASPPTTVIINSDLLHRLTADARELPNIVVTADTHEALHRIQLEIGVRYTAAASPPPASGPPPTILMTSPPADGARLAALAILGHDLNVYTVVDGAWNGGATWQVDEDGYASEDDARCGRLNKLSQHGIRELAELLRPSPAATSPPPSTMSPPRLHLSILGQPRLQTTPAQQPVKLRRSGAWQIATYLALHPDGASRTDLIEQIFGEMKTADAAATSLNTCLHELRRALTIDQHSALLTVDGGYRLDHNQISVDWWNLQTLLYQGDLTAAVALYHGPIAQGYQWDWLPEHRQSARRVVADAYALLADAATDPDKALALGLAGIGVNPHGQRCYAAAIQAHLHMNNTHGAEILYRDLEQRLSRSGTRADPKITKLLNGDPAAACTTSA